ncbi:MAG: LysR family transcriptional regulator [Selenomonadaceae bacterium]|nr:LysR family transcriptional regulator [Selenomonadaceae bacterium]
MISHSLKIFLSVAEKGSVTETANELFISQPAVSKTIKTLEQKLNLKLFYRDKRRGLILTDAGEKILLLARQMENLEERIYQTAFSENNFLGGKVRVASVPIATTLILSGALKDYRAKYPAVTVELKEGTPANVQKILENYIVDFAITYSPFGNFDSEILLEDEMVGIGSAKNSVELGDGVENLIFCRAGFEVVRKIFDIDADKNLVVQNAETAVKFVEAGNGVGVISKLVLATTNGRVKICRVEPSIKMQLGLAAHDLKDLPPLAAELVRLIKNHIAA